MEELLVATKHQFKALENAKKSKRFFIFNSVLFCLDKELKILPRTQIQKFLKYLAVFEALLGLFLINLQQNRPILLEYNLNSENIPIKSQAILGIKKLLRTLFAVIDKILACGPWGRNNTKNL